MGAVCILADPDRGLPEPLGCVMHPKLWGKKVWHCREVASSSRFVYTRDTVFNDDPASLYTTLGFAEFSEKLKQYVTLSFRVQQESLHAW